MPLLSCHSEAASQGKSMRHLIPHPSAAAAAPAAAAPGVAWWLPAPAGGALRPPPARLVLPPRQLRLPPSREWTRRQATTAQLRVDGKETCKQCITLQAGGNQPEPAAGHRAGSLPPSICKLYKLYGICCMLCNAAQTDRRTCSTSPISFSTPAATPVAQPSARRRRRARSWRRAAQ